MSDRYPTYEKVFVEYNRFTDEVMRDAAGCWDDWPDPEGRSSFILRDAEIEHGKGGLVRIKGKLDAARCWIDVVLPARYVAAA